MRYLGPACGTLFGNRRTSVNDIGGPNQKITFFSQEFFLLKFICFYDLFNKILLLDIILVRGRFNICPDVGKIVLQKVLRTGIVKNRTVFFCNIFQGYPNATHEF
jgi:hypothetical protein